ncbi:MAG: hypothetical protein JXA33_10145 [Anaerolineae bacterium]|nr:hypothetical protein [Anaerolineae bacterium]
MSITTFTAQTLPQSPQALRETLQQALEKHSPLEDFIQLVRDLTRFEMQYQMNSTEFFHRFQQGELGDQMDYLRWANEYEMYQEAKANSVRFA